MRLELEISSEREGVIRLAMSEGEYLQIAEREILGGSIEPLFSLLAGTGLWLATEAAVARWPELRVEHAFTDLIVSVKPEAAS